MVVLSTGEIVRNELGGHSSASLVGYSGKERYIGEAALAQSSTNAANTVRVGEWLTEEEKRDVPVKYNNETLELTRSAATGSLCRKLCGLAESAIQNKKLPSAERLVLAVPPCWSSDQLADVGLSLSTVQGYEKRLANADRCLCHVYAYKHPPSEPRVVALVNVGRRTSSVTIAKFSPEENYEILASEWSQDPSFAGTKALDEALYGLALSKVGLPSVEGKKKARVLASVEKLRKLLSTMHEASVTCENLRDDSDVEIVVSRDEFRSACSASLKKFEEMLVKMPVDSVELVGGGSRVAIVREVVSSVYKVEEAFGAKLDDASAAHGACLLPDEFLSSLPVEESSEIAAAENEMCKRDEEILAIGESKNSLETRILRLRASRGGPHSELVTPELFALLDECEGWMWEADDDADFKAKQVELEEKAKELCPKYFEAVEREELAAKERAMQEDAANEQEGEEDGDDDEKREDRLNADTRKLKFSDRFRLVQKNKDEGSELFKDGNFLHSAKRYKDALAHAGKLTHDLSPEQQDQTKRIKIDLHLNMSLCWTKLDNVEQSLRSCDEALKLDGDHPKALYRRAYAYENLKRFDEAKEDVKKALSVAPNDKAILQLQKRIDAQIARQKKKEKAMWGKAFQ